MFIFLKLLFKSAFAIRSNTEYNCYDIHQIDVPSIVLSHYSSMYKGSVELE